MNSKDFNKLPELQSEPSCSFKLGPREWHVKNSTNVPWSLIEKSMQAQTEMQVGPYFEALIVPSEVDEFLEMINGPRSPLTAGNVVPLMTWITEQVMKRPTQRPGRSSIGSQNGTPKSRAGSSSRVTRKQASAS